MVMFAITSKSKIIENQASQYPDMNSYEKSKKKTGEQPDFQDVQIVEALSLSTDLHSFHLLSHDLYGRKADAAACRTF